MIVGCDIGKYQSRFVYSPLAQFSFKSKLYVYRPLKVENQLSENDLIIEYKGEKYLGGNLGEREGEIPYQFVDSSKAHLTTLINLLAGLHRLPVNSFRIVIGCPISIRTEKEKDRLRQLVKGVHKVAVNGNEKVINIESVEVGPEGAAGYYAEPKYDDCQGFDFGSTTTNHFYISSKRFIDKRSGTFPYGSENSVTSNRAGLIKVMHSQLTTKFERDRPTMIMGGLAQTMLPYVRGYYPGAYVVDDPIFATARGLYEIARAIYD